MTPLEPEEASPAAPEESPGWDDPNPPPSEPAPEETAPAPVVAAVVVLLRLLLPLRARPTAWLVPRCLP